MRVNGENDKGPQIGRRRGRPRLQFQAYEPNGRRSRRRAAREYRENRCRRQARETAIEARKRIFGLSDAEAARPEAATALGRLRLKGEREEGRCGGGPLCQGISRKQYLAGVAHQKARIDYLHAIAAPDGLRRSAGKGGGRHRLSKEYIAWCRRARETYLNAFQALGSDPALQGAVRVVVFEDGDAPRLIGDLRCALNILARVYRV